MGVCLIPKVQGAVEENYAVSKDWKLGVHPQPVSIVDVLVCAYNDNGLES